MLCGSDELTSPSPKVAVPFRIFDIEIAKSIEETPGGWDGARKGLSGMSCACVYDSETNHTWLFGPLELEALADALEGPVVVVSYNGLGFDVPALEGMLGRKLNIRTHLDLLDLFVTAVGGRRGLGLENMSRLTLGKGKAGTGEQAPKMYQRALEGDKIGVQEAVNLLKYCSFDNVLVRDLIRFIQDNGFVVGPSGPIHLTLPPYFMQLAR